jgi:hypothetical protein
VIIVIQLDDMKLAENVIAVTILAYTEIYDTIFVVIGNFGVDKFGFGKSDVAELRFGEQVFGNYGLGNKVSASSVLVVGKLAINNLVFG